jgi:AcrR family transcriptional regulator
MGLRQQKAERARRTMVDVAVELFIADGYDETSMEQIAERAEVSPSTLYRYFPTKDLLILDRLVSAMDLGPRLTARPEDEPLDEALAAALHDAMRVFDDPAERLAEIRAVVDASPSPRARLWDVLISARHDLEVEIGRRMGLEPDALAVQLTAGFAVELLSIADEERKRSADGGPVTDIVDRMLRELPTTEFVRPAAPRPRRARTAS